MGTKIIPDSHRMEVGVRAKKYFGIKFPFYRLNVLGMLGLGLILFLVAAACIGPFIAPFDPYFQDLSVRLSPPGAVYYLGTDELGRDIFSRLLHGARTTLLIVLLAVSYTHLRAHET